MIETLDDTQYCQGDKPDQGPLGNGKGEKGPAHGGAFARALENHFQSLQKGVGLQNIIKTRTAGGNLIGGEVLQPHLAGRNGCSGAGGKGYQYRIDAGADVARVMQGCKQKNCAQPDHEDSLENAQGAGIFALNMLKVEGKADESRSNEETQNIKQATAQNEDHGCENITGMGSDLS